MLHRNTSFHCKTNYFMITLNKITNSIFSIKFLLLVKLNLITTFAHNFLGKKILLDKDNEFFICVQRVQSFKVNFTIIKITHNNNAIIISSKFKVNSVKQSVFSLLSLILSSFIIIWLLVQYTRITFNSFSFKLLLKY